MEKYLYNRTSDTNKNFFQCVIRAEIDTINGYGDTLQVFDGRSLPHVSDFNVAKDLLKDLAAGTLSPDLEDTIRAMQRAGRKFSDEIADALDPQSIVDTALFWDNLDLVYWFAGRYEVPGVLTYNGGVIFDADLRLSK